jgi:Bifunctional DNA primase/polymerase, N-terminal
VIEETAAGDLLAAALNYAARGWRVLPLHDVTPGVCSCRDGTACKTPGKHPRLKEWQRVASTDPGLIAGWWAGWPTANVGIATGRRSNLIVLDVDPRHGGDKQLQALIAEHEPLPDTVIVQTGGGGWHYYFACPPGDGAVDSGDIAEGLEIKAAGTFVVAPPSRT